MAGKAPRSIDGAGAPASGIENLPQKKGDETVVVSSPSVFGLTLHEVDRLPMFDVAMHILLRRREHGRYDIDQEQGDHDRRKAV